MMLQYMYQQHICSSNATSPNYSIWINEASRPIYVPSMNPLASTMWPRVPYTNDDSIDNDSFDIDNDDATAWLQKQTWSLAKSAKYQTKTKQTKMRKKQTEFILKKDWFHYVCIPICKQESQEDMSSVCAHVHAYIYRYIQTCACFLTYICNPRISRFPYTILTTFLEFYISEIHTLMYTYNSYIYAYTHTYMHDAYIHTQTSVCLLAYIFIQTCIHSYMSGYIHKCLLYTYICTNIIYKTYILMHVWCRYRVKHSCLFAYIHAYTLLYGCLNIYTSTCIHKKTHACSHECLAIYMHSYIS